MTMNSFRNTSYLVVAAGLWGCNGKAESDSRVPDDGRLRPELGL
jgi:hypothetical protein